MSDAKYSIGKVQWQLQDCIREVCLSNLPSEGLQALNIAEDLLITFIVAVALNMSAPTDYLCLWLWDINPSALTLGHIYFECGLYGEASTLLSWGEDFSSQKPRAQSLKCLLRCFQKLQLMDEDHFNALNGELENLSYLGNSRNGRVATGAWAVVKDGRFKDSWRMVREREEKTQGVKKRFYDCLKRNGRSDFEIVDAIWGAMLTKRYPDK